MMDYRISCKIDPEHIAKLRKSVGWNGMIESYKKSLKNSYFYICCFDHEELVGFLDVVSNGITDAYIQDVIVHPSYQNTGIGTKLMNISIEKLQEDHVYAISVVFEEKLLAFYKRFGFNILQAGQLQTREEE